MIKRKHINTYRTKFLYNKVEYSTGDGTYGTKNDAKAPFIMLEFSRRKKLHAPSILIMQMAMLGLSVT